MQARHFSFPPKQSKIENFQTLLLKPCVCMCVMVEVKRETHLPLLTELSRQRGTTRQFLHPRKLRMKGNCRHCQCSGPLIEQVSEGGGWGRERGATKKQEDCYRKWMTKDVGVNFCTRIRHFGMFLKLCDFLKARQGYMNCKFRKLLVIKYKLLIRAKIKSL